MDIFDPELLLQSTTTEASVRRPPIPAGTFLQGTIETVVARPWTSQAKGTSGVAIDFTIKVDTSMVKDQPESIILRDGIMLDLTPSGTIDYGVGKNNGLRRYREATGLNVHGQPFSIPNLVGRPIKVEVGHREYQGEIFDEVKAISKA